MTILARNYVLELTVFVCGALVMIFEIVGSRILAPFIGTSTYVWTSLIGVILAALSLGYWLGGKMADRKPDVKVLAAAIFAAGGLVSLTITLKEIVLTAISASGVMLEFQSVVAAIFLFAPASVALGFVTPYAVKLRMESLGDAGKTVGRLYALSTVGSIVGTFAAGFFLIPFVGSVRTLYLIAGALFAVSLMLVPFTLKRWSVGMLLLFALGVTTSELARFATLRSYDHHDIDTEYSRIQVFKTDHPPSGRRIQAISTDPFYLQSAMYLDGEELVFEYTRFYHLLPHLKPDFQNTLMIGGAGYSFPKSYLATYPHAKMDVVEIDPQMTEIARRFFRLQDDPRLNIIHRDGRIFLNQAQPEIYDAVFMDAFGSLFSVPYQLTTVEAVREIHRVLKPDGVVIFNVGSAIRGPASKFLQAEFRTYQEVFPHVYLFKVNADRSDDDLQNLIVVACRSNCLVNPAAEDALTASLLNRRYEAQISLGLPTLTDDLAPVERYNSIAQAAK